jgi:hypothetical protein
MITAGSGTRYASWNNRGTGNAMIEVYVDDRKHPISGQAASTLADVIEHVRTSVREADRLIVSIACEGRELDDDELTASLSLPAASMGRIDMLTRPARDVAAEIFDHAVALFDATRGPSEEAVELLARGQTVRAMEILAGNLRSWHTAHESVLHVVRLLALEIDAEAVERFRGALSEVRDALLNRDFVTLGDLLQYEAPDAINQWRDAIADLKGDTDATPS